VNKVLSVDDHGVLTYNEQQMTSHDLRAFLTEFELTQADFARLLGITLRAVALWVAGERTIPTTVDAYVRVFRLLPLNLRQIELNRLKQKGTNMRDGMFGITFQGQHGKGMGVLIFDSGKVYGTDEAAVRYDGDYIFDEASGLVGAKVKVTFPPNVKAVQGISNPYEWSIIVETKFDPRQNSGTLKLKTSLGQPLDARYVFLRSLPEAA
jgi:DNA-binding transcriptional regulator YiaG